MLENLEPAIRNALMLILSAIYESGLVEEVDLRDVVRLFGVTDTGNVTSRFSFNESDWLEAYRDFNEHRKLNDSQIASIDLSALQDELNQFDFVSELEFWEPEGKSN